MYVEDKIIEERIDEFFACETPEFYHCKFQKIDFSNTDLKSVVFSDCEFSACNLSNLQVQGAQFRSCAFKNCKILGINWCQVFVVSHLSFDDCLLNYNVFANLDLRNSSFVNCSIKEADFSEANLGKADFSGSDLSATVFNRTNLIGVDFRESKNYTIDPNENRIRKAKFSIPEALSLLQCYEIEIS